MGLSWGNTATTPSSPYQQRLYRVDEVRSYPTPALTQINPGDLIFWNSSAGCVALASNAVFDSNILTTQEDVAPVFLGVSLDQKNAADPTTRPIAVATKGAAVYPCAALGQAQDPGSYVAPSAQGTHNLSDQQVVVPTNVAGAIGKTNQYAASGATQLQFDFQSSLVFGKTQPAS